MYEMIKRLLELVHIIIQCHYSLCNPLIATGFKVYGPGPGLEWEGVKEKVADTKYKIGPQIALEVNECIENKI